MDTALNPKQTDPHHVLVARADEELAHAHEQIARADEQLARADEQLSKLEHDAVPGNRPLFDRPAVRGLTGLLLAACIGVAAIAWQSSYGDAAREIIARGGPPAVCESTPAARNPGPPRAAEPTCRSGGRGEDSTSTTSTSGSDRTGRRRADRRRFVARVDAVAPVDGARSRNPGARNRAAQGQPGTNVPRQCERRRAAHGHPAPNGPRQCERRRAVQGEPGTNRPRHCQGFRAEPTAQDTNASATAGCHPDAQDGAAALTIPALAISPRWPSRPPSTIPNASFGPR